jgi:hypothetical protein
MKRLDFGILPPSPDTKHLADYLRNMASILEQNAERFGTPLPNVYAFTNTTVPLRTLNASTATTAQIVNFLATFFQDMASRGNVKTEVS